MRKKINIAFITDDNYVIPTAVAITSLIKNKNAESLYNIYIVTTLLSDQNTKMFEQFNRSDVTIHIMVASLEKFSGIHKQQKKSVCVASEAALLKFELPALLKKCKKVLYLDGDILVQKDLSELYNIDVNSFMCAAAYDTGCLYSANPKFAKYRQYFNSGVMLLNLEKMRMENVSKKLYLAKKRSTDYNLMDQDVFNEVFDKQVRIIDIKYNCLIINLKRARDKYKFEALNNLFGTNYSSLQNVEYNAVILHFASKDKPWKYTDAEYSILWNEYFLQSPYADKVLEKISLKQEMGIKYPVYVSLTSYPSRIQTISQTINSLLKQTVKADKIIIWLAKEQFPNKEKDLPQDLLDLTKIGLEIEWCTDIKSYKKLIPALKKYPDAIVVTADDDILYSRGWLEIMLKSYLKNPTKIHCHRAHMIRFDDGNIVPYRQWQQNIRSNSTLYNGFPTSGAGILFPPHCLHSDVFDVAKFMHLCPNADDIWFWAMAVKNNTPIKVVENNISKLRFVEGTQEQALWHKNVIGGQNDVQLRNVLNEYPEIKDKLDKNILKNKKTSAPKMQKTAIFYRILKYIPLFTYKRRGGNQVWKVFGLPVWRVRRIPDIKTVKFYLFGLPLLSCYKKK